MKRSKTNIMKNDVKRMRMSDVAQALGLSRATVSYVLNGKAVESNISEATVKRIEEMARKLHYVPNRSARSLMTRHSQTIGVLVGGVWGKFGQEILDGMQPVLDKRAYLPIVALHRWSEDRERKEIQALLTMNVDGVIVQPHPTSRSELYQPLIGAGVPVLFFGDAPKDMPEANVVAWDGLDAARAGVEYLISIGRKRIAFAGQRYPFRHNEDRFAGYRQTLKKCKLPFKRDWVVWDEVTDVGESLLNGILSRSGDERPDSIFAMNDSTGLQAIQQLLREGIRIPDDIAVLGLGDISETMEFTAVLTNVREPLAEMARQAATGICDLIEQPGLPTIRRLVAGTELVKRCSTEGGPRGLAR